MIICPFCQNRLDKVGHGLGSCGRCGAQYLTARNDQRARIAIAGALDCKPDKVSVMPAGTGVYAGWNNEEKLTALQIAAILGRSKPLVQQYLREGRFEDAEQFHTEGGMPYWAVPRAAVFKFRLAGRKPYSRPRRASAGDSHHK